MSGKDPSDPPVGSGGRKESSGPDRSGRAAISSSSRNDPLPKRIVNSVAGLSTSVLSSRSVGSLRPEDVGLADKGSSGPSTSSDGAASNRTFGHDGIGTGMVCRPGSDEKGDKPEENFQGFLGHPSPNVDHGPLINETPGRNVEQSSAEERTVDSQERHDGDEVTALLANPNSLQFTDNIDFGSVPAQLPRLRAALQGDEGMPSSTWDHLLNFWPVADDNLESNRPAWLAQWKDVLTRYTDEVWGELGSDVRQAKEEVEAELQQDQDDERGLQSLRRLRQILAHLRGS